MILRIFFILLTLPFGLSSAEQNFSLESYDLRISGLSTLRDGTLQLYGIVKSFSAEAPALNYCPPEQAATNDPANTWSEQVYEAVEKGLPPKSSEFNISNLKPGDCYKNLCFIGLSEDKKDIIITYKKNGEWQWGAIPRSSMNQNFAIDMDYIPGTKRALQAALDQWHELFPENFMPSYVNLSFGSGTGIYQKGLKFVDGKFTTGYSVPKENIPPNLSQIFSTLKSKYKIVTIAGIPTIEEPVESCEEFRKSLTGGHIYANELLALTYRIAVRCKDGSNIGYCNPDTFNPGVSTARCETQSKLPELNECGGSAKKDDYQNKVVDYGLTRNNLLNMSIMNKNGSSCTLDSQRVSVFIYESVSSGVLRGSTSFIVDMTGLNQGGTCFGGECLSDEVKTCRLGLESVLVAFFEDEFANNFGQDALKHALDDKEYQLTKKFPQIEKFLSNPENRQKFSGYRPNAGNISSFKQENGTACPGGLCQNGECIPFQQLLGGGGTSNACRNLENGNPCEFISENASTQGFCFQNECYLCNSSLPERLVGAPACPENPAFPGITGYRANCATPDICSYL